MALRSPLQLLLLFVGAVAAWSRTDHWQMIIRSRGSTSFITSSTTVIPTAAVTPISSNISTTLQSVRGHGGGALYRSGYTIEVTVKNLFYAANASGLCPYLSSCRSDPTPTTSSTASITTNYYAPVVISNPVSCTRTRFAYTTAKSIRVHPTDVTTAIPNFSEQATQSVHALLVTTYVSTLSTNLGGQDVTTSVCEVYFREGAVTGLEPDTGAHLECVDPRVHDCSVALARASHFQSSQVFDPSTSAACQTDLRYPPASVVATGTAGSVGDATSTSGVLAGLRSNMRWLFGVAGAVALLGLF